MVGQSITFNGVDLSGASYGFIMTSGQNPLMGQRLVPYVKLPHRAGGVSAPSHYDSMTLRLEGVIVGDEGTMTDRVRLVAQALRHHDPKKLILSTYDDRFYWAVCRGIEQTAQGPGWRKVVIDFFMSDPRAYESETTFASLHTVDPTTYNVIENTRADVSMAKVILNPDPSEVGSALTVENVSTGQIMAVGAWTQNAGGTKRFRFDGVRKVFEVSTDSGATWTIDMSTFTGEFIHLLPGQTNLVKLTGMTVGGGLGTIEVKREQVLA